MSSEKIGLVLRDTYGIPSTKIIAGKITNILARNNLKQEPAAMVNLQTNAEKLKLHMVKNKQDKVAKRSFQITQAKITTLGKYYKRKSE